MLKFKGKLGQSQRWLQLINYNSSDVIPRRYEEIHREIIPLDDKW